MAIEIPDKVYFKIGEAAEIIGVETYVLRYWETEFPQVKLVRAGSKQRLYRRQDIETLLDIKRLLYDEKYTIAGARKRIAAKHKTDQDIPDQDNTALLKDIKKALLDIKDTLKG